MRCAAEYYWDILIRAHQQWLCSTKCSSRQPCRRFALVRPRLSLVVSHLPWATEHHFDYKLGIDLFRLGATS